MGQKLTRICHILVICLFDWLLICIANGLALLVRFDFSFSSIPVHYLFVSVLYTGIQLIVTTVLFLLLRMYHYVWHTVNVRDVFQMLISVPLTFLVCLFINQGLLDLVLPKSILFMMMILSIVFLVGMRCSLRFWSLLRHYVISAGGRGERIMLIGAGAAGHILAHEILTSPQIHGSLCCFIDDNPHKKGMFMDGVPIVGGRDDIEKAVQHYNITQIIFSIPTASPKDKAEILNICKSTHCRLRVLPGLYQMVNGEVNLAAVKDVQIEDLLGRTPVKLDTEGILAFLQGKTVLVTGGGGSIGSELCRQIAKYHPGHLIILDIYENNAYDIQQELIRTYGSALHLTVEIASIRDKKRIYDLFDKHRPQIIFHAAAHKHVPLMENCPSEAIKNNIFGTYHVVRASEKFGVEKFVMISTDKAVNPTNFMGATKRFCEMILQSRQSSHTEFCAVRFGNVLGSNGSVVPLFKRQIAAGGPITITDRRIIRYFMTIPEAAMLVLEAGVMASRGQIFVLDMGEPVKILTLAENLIRLSALEPYKDIQIEEVGLRPGEKLYEELLMKSEHLLKTPNEKIFIEQQSPISAKEIMDHLQLLDEAVTHSHTNEELIGLMKQLVSTYHSPEEVNQLS